jgi:hypothetical protein
MVPAWMKRKTNWAASAVGVLLGATALPVIPLGLTLGSPAVAWAQNKPTEKVDPTDKIILRNGRIIEGKVLEESDTRIRFMIVTAGISAPQWFDKSDVLKVERGEAKTDAAKAEPAKDPSAPKAAAATPPAADARKVYVIELSGQFGEDITQTPIRQAVADAKEKGAEYLIFVLNNEWSINDGGIKEQLPNDTAAFDELFRTEEITPIFMNEIPREWEHPPKVVFWIKQAMGGAAFLPFVCPTIYMSSESRWGGIGNLSNLFGSTGDELVRQKQYSLRMGHAEGWANAGGYDYRLVKAMARVEYVLSYKMVGGKPVLLERMPESPDEFLLTDDGKDERADTIQDLARGRGNDVLTLNADLARKLFISKGTVDRLEDLIFELGVSRNYTRVDEKSKSIMEGWSRALTNAKNDLRRLVREFRQIQVQGDYNERARARGAQIAKLNDMKRIISRFKEALTPRWFAQNGFPGGSADDVIAWIDGQIEQIRQQQLLDKK